MIRLFVGIELPDSVKEALYKLHGGVTGAKWRTPDRMHITLRFVGNMDESVAEEILRELRYVRFPAFHLTCQNIGYFDVAGIPHHLWIGLDNTKVLEELHDKIDKAVKRAGGGDKVSFKFMPHITLAKLQGTSMDEVFNFIRANNLFKSEQFLVNSFSLFSSHARENGEGKYYEVEEEYPLSLV